MAVDCGSLSKELAPSAFFGHVKGAFTGADNAKKGYFHEAEGGTLFLDEVGNLALETQQMLLRAIQERRYRPVGDKADRNFNVRIIAATNEDLEVSVNEKRFRQDLLYRLHDFGITVPPLRDCQEDIMPLAEFFRDCYGVMSDTFGPEARVVRLKITAFQANYVRDLPLHESQQEIERNDEYSIFELFVRPTYDLYQEVLRMGTQVEVLEPNYMREEILEMIRIMYNQYTK